MWLSQHIRLWTSVCIKFRAGMTDELAGKSSDCTVIYRFMKKCTETQIETRDETKINYKIHIYLKNCYLMHMQ